MLQETLLCKLYAKFHILNSSEILTNSILLCLNFPLKKVGEKIMIFAASVTLLKLKLLIHVKKSQVFRWTVLCVYQNDWSFGSTSLPPRTFQMVCTETPEMLLTHFGKVS